MCTTYMTDEEVSFIYVYTYKCLGKLVHEIDFNVRKKTEFSFIVSAGKQNHHDNRVGRRYIAENSDALKCIDSRLFREQY